MSSRGFDPSEEDFFEQDRFQSKRTYETHREQQSRISGRAIAGIIFGILLLTTVSIAVTQIIIDGTLLFEDYQRIGLQLHNEHRKLHHAKSLKLNGTLNKIAKTCAKYYAGMNKIDHSCPEAVPVGENLFMSWNARKSEQDTIKFADKVWYDEQKDYNYTTGQSKNGRAIEHFTQLVWKGTKEVGFGYYYLEETETCVVAAVYFPPGNFRTRFIEIVDKPGKSSYAE